MAVRYLNCKNMNIQDNIFLTEIQKKMCGFQDVVDLRRKFNALYYYKILWHSENS